MYAHLKNTSIASTIQPCNLSLCEKRRSSGEKSSPRFSQCMHDSSPQPWYITLQIVSNFGIRKTVHMNITWPAGIQTIKHKFTNIHAGSRFLPYEINLSCYLSLSIFLIFHFITTKALILRTQNGKTKLKWSIARYHNKTWNTTLPGLLGLPVRPIDTSQIPCSCWLHCGPDKFIS